MPAMARPALPGGAGSTRSVASVASSIVDTGKAAATRTHAWLTTPSLSHVLIIALLGSLGGGLAVPLELPILRQFACDWHYRDRKASSSSISALGTLVGSLFFTLEPIHSHAFVAADGQARNCNIPDVAKLAGEIITSARVLNAVITVLCLTVYSDLLSRFGRRPMFAFTAFCLTLSILFFGIGAKIRGAAGIYFIITSFALTGFGSQPLLQLTFQSYIVECVKTKDRSPAFALLGSATFAGLATAALASAGMTAYLEQPLMPFWVGTAMFTAMLLYSLFILPEALTEKRQEELMQANEDLHNGGNTPPSRASDSAPASTETRWSNFTKRVNFVKKFAVFLPTRNDQGVKDYRLFILAISFTIYRIGSMYMNDLLLLTTTGSFGFEGVDNGLLLAFITASKAILLMGVLPIVIRQGRTKYVEWLAQRSSVQPTMEGLSESTRLLNSRHRSYDDANAESETMSQSGGSAGPEKSLPKGTERFDIYFGGCSFLVDAAAFAAIGLSRRKWQLYASTAFLALSAAGGPSAQAVATEVTPKAMSDQVLGALSLIDEAGALLSPLILGSIYSASAGSVPSLAWYVSSGLLALSALLMLSTPSFERRKQ